HEAERRAVVGAEPLKLKILDNRRNGSRGALRDLARRFFQIATGGLQLLSRALELTARLLALGAALCLDIGPFARRFLQRRLLPALRLALGLLLLAKVLLLR